MITRDELIELGFQKEDIGKAFKIIKGVKDRNECLKLLAKLKNGEEIERKSFAVKKDSCLEFLLNMEFCPSAQVSAFASNSEKRRMLEQKAVTFNSFKLGPDDELPRPLWELIFFKGAKRQCSMWWDEETHQDLIECMTI